ncbi:MAG: putative DNA modification/repair radical SAM protein [Armatimonadota bacterium]|nr:MAG: putative DNA modification/repair radical SAM protein [Armatimonadota bacterium]
MDRLDKLTTLGSAARFDVCAASCGGRPRRTAPPPPTDPATRFIARAALPEGGSVALFKVLQTNACRHNCLYCANRAERGQRRTRFQPDELASLFVDFYNRGYVQGLFLSSGVEGSPARTMADMLTTAEIVRDKHGFRGYIHLKVLPGAPYDCVERATELANRVSVNMEAPTEARLTRIAPDKHMPGDVIQRMHWIRRAASAGDRLMSAGQTTQFIVGAGRETDREIVTSADALYRDVNLRRAYFSAFQPISETPLEEQPPAPQMREHRLYQVDWLLRRYAGLYALGDVVFDADGNLPLGLDPKLAIAFAQRETFPVEINRADYRDLLRVPGIGPKSAKAIVTERRSARFADIAELRRVGVVVRRASPFLLINGQAQGSFDAFLREQLGKPTADQQLSLPLPW